MDRFCGTYLKTILTKGYAPGIMKNQNDIRERVDGKKYLCLKADRELPVGERREKDRGKIHPGAAGLKGEVGFAGGHRYQPEY